MPNASLKRVYIVNEMTVWPLLAHALVGNEVYILEVSPTVQRFARIMEPLLIRLRRRKNVKDARELAPDWDSIWAYPLRATFYDVFGKTEAWHNTHFNYDDTKLTAHYDIFAYKQITCNYMKPIHVRLLKLYGIFDAHERDNVAVIGEGHDSKSLRDAYKHASVSTPPPSTSKKYASFLINVLIFLSINMLTVFWILSRMRPCLTAPKEYSLGADYYPNGADFRIYDEVSPDAPILLIKRNETQPTGFPEMARHHMFKITDGRLEVLQGLQLIGRTLLDSFQHFQNAATRCPAHFYLLAMVPLRRAIFVALFRRFRPKLFWGRDDYNVEHILRREALNAVGGKSFGIAHGMPAYAILFPMWRYISFDTYYIHSLAIYERALKHTWDKNMRVVPIGSFNATRKDYELIDIQRPEDIAIYVAAFVGDPRMCQFVREMAKAFPDRTIYLQIKSTFVDKDFGIEFIAACCHELVNIQHTTAPLFDLFRMARYGFSDPSTLIIEGLQFGQLTFYTDIMPEQETSIYRDFPSVCVTSAKDGMQRILALESGEAEDPRPSLNELVHFSKTPFFDVLKRDMGVATRDAPSSGEHL